MLRAIRVAEVLTAEFGFGSKSCACTRRLLRREAMFYCVNNKLLAAGISGTRSIAKGTAGGGTSTAART